MVTITLAPKIAMATQTRTFVLGVFGQNFNSPRLDDNRKTQVYEIRRLNRALT